jgi:ABC-2 type transport system ATP-binding protein
VVLSSHLLQLVEELCTKLLVVRRGTCVAYGSIAEIISAHPDLAGKSLEDVFLALTGGEAAATT